MRKNYERNKKKIDNKGILYLLYSKNQNLYKIGITEHNVTKRIASMLTADPSIIIIAETARIPNYKLLERELHNQFVGYRKAREWFSLNSDQIALLKSFYKKLSYPHLSPYRQRLQELKNK